MNQYYLGNTLINDSYIGSIRVEDLIAQQQAIVIEYLVVAGGGSAQFVSSEADSGGGGGAGGLRSGSAVIQPFQTSITAIVGNGGTYSGGVALNGGNSSFIGSGISLTSTGGGRGGFTNTDGANGGSGGGDGGGSGGPGTGIAGQGFGGGVAGNITGNRQGGGGGGAAGAGTNVSGITSGGPGATWFIFGTYSRGGKGQRSNNGATGGSNTGNGGGSLGFDEGINAGGSGIIHVRYAGPQVASGGSVSYSNGYTYHTFTSGTGSFTY